MWYKRPVALQWGEWNKWHKSTKAKHPIQYFFRETVDGKFRRIRMKITSFKWAILHRIHPKHRYHVVKVRSLKPGYHDPSELILHASFDMLSQYAERRLMGSGIKGTKWDQCDIDHFSDDKSYNSFLNQIDKEADIIALRNWWVNDRPNREKYEKDLIDGHPPAPAGIEDDMWIFDERLKDTEEYKRYREWSNKLSELDEKWEKEDQEKLKELVDLRNHIWY